MKLLSTIIGVIGMGMLGFSQQDFTLYNMSQIPQSSYTNPSTIPNAKVNISIAPLTLPLLTPSLYISSSNSGFKFNDFAKKRSKDDSLEVDMENLLGKLKAKNYFTNNLEMDLINIGFRLKEKNYISFTVIEKVNFNVTYPKDLLVLAWEGNGRSLLGNRASFDGLGIDMSHYREYGLSFAREFNDKLTVGAKVKYLYGMENIQTKTSEIGLTTDQTTFDLSYDLNMEIRTSGMAQYFDTAQTGGVSAGKYLFGLKNRGVGIDIGGSYKVTDKIAVSASVVDLGAIKWTENVKSTTIKGNFKYTGLDISTLVKTNNVDSVTGTIPQDTTDVLTLMVDSIRNSTETTTNTNSYTTSLPTKIYLGGTYQLKENMTVGVLGYGTFFKGRFRAGLSASYNLTIKKFFSASVTYSVYNRAYSNLGLGLAVNAGFYQIYAVTDNVLYMVAPQSFRNGHIRMGVNYTFGRKDKTKIKDTENPQADF